jgi:hypothetical protein
MWQLAVAFLIFVVLLTVLVRAGAVWTGRTAGRSTRRRFEEAEHIVQTGRPPESWLAATAKLDGPRRRRELLRRLEKLVEFFRTSPVVADEATRELLLARLSDARKPWDETREDRLPDESPSPP